ncbi:serine/threonine-protein kinase -related [Anaeramoeba flamelloides]|uniref:Serine/threonine-protein kinase -related n=1 Tax=Anaeramoeba flamelloides TaxID=1746091 RepID=A0AAV7Z5I6_9EUKA|nr:serine/threonine-protein kinase -related [Anaeramoeba flamelloides]
MSENLVNLLLKIIEEAKTLEIHKLKFKAILKKLLRILKESKGFVVQDLHVKSFQQILENLKQMIKKFNTSEWLQNLLQSDERVSSNLKKLNEELHQVSLLIGLSESSSALQFKLSVEDNIKDLAQIRDKLLLLLKQKKKKQDNSEVFKLIKNKIKIIEQELKVELKKELVKNTKQQQQQQQQQQQDQSKVKQKKDQQKQRQRQRQNQKQKKKKKEPLNIKRKKEKKKHFHELQELENQLKNSNGLQDPKKELFLVDPEEFIFGKLIGKGGFGRVFRGTWKGKEVAIKIILKELINKENLKAFRKEIYLLSTLKHQNIIQFLGASLLKEPYCVVTEFVSGGSLFSLIHKNRNINLANNQIKGIAIEIANGMDYLHSYGIIHRDLKSLNVLLDENYASVQICDFGMARVRQNRMQNKLLMTAQIGTTFWMAPEVLAGSAYDIKCDVYSYGILLYELATRRIPYKELNYTPIQIAFAVVNDRLRPRFIETDDVSLELKELISKCLDHRPFKRPTFKEILKLISTENFIFPKYNRKIFSQVRKDFRRRKEEQDNLPKEFSKSEKEAINFSDSLYLPNSQVQKIKKEQEQEQEQEKKHGQEKEKENKNENQNEKEKEKQKPNHPQNKKDEKYLIEKPVPILTKLVRFLKEKSKNEEEFPEFAITFSKSGGLTGVCSLLVSTTTIKALPNQLTLLINHNSKSEIRSIAKLCCLTLSYLVITDKTLIFLRTEKRLFPWLVKRFQLNPTDKIIFRLISKLSRDKVIRDKFKARSLLKFLFLNIEKNLEIIANFCLDENIELKLKSTNLLETSINLLNSKESSTRSHAIRVISKLINFKWAKQQNFDNYSQFIKTILKFCQNAIESNPEKIELKKWKNEQILHSLNLLRNLSNDNKPIIGIIWNCGEEINSIIDNCIDLTAPSRVIIECSSFMRGLIQNYNDLDYNFIENTQLISKTINSIHSTPTRAKLDLLKILSIIVCNSDNCTRQLCKKNSITIIAKFLHKSNEIILKNTLTILGCCAKLIEGANIISQINLIPICSGLISHEEMDIKLSSLTFINNISKHPQYIESIIESGSLFSLITLVNSKNYLIFKKVIPIIIVLAKDKDALRIMKESRVIQNLTLLAFNEKIFKLYQENSMNGSGNENNGKNNLHNFSIKSLNALLEFVKLGEKIEVMPQIIKFSKNENTTIIFLIKALSLLSELVSQRDKDNIQLAKKLGIFKALEIVSQRIQNSKQNQIKELKDLLKIVLILTKKFKN